MGIKLYNKLSNKIREVEKLGQFETEFRSYLLQHIFYSANECMSHALAEYYF